jgi:hypothetical protein
MNGLFLRVRIFRLSCFIICFFSVLTVSGQEEEEAPRRGSKIIDDTTKQVYGPRTSRYYFEDDVFYNRYTLRQVDTVIRNFHRFDEVQRHENLYQDLGVVGTSIQPIYYQTPDVIGVRSGFSQFDMFWEREAIRYWDTKSPYTNMNVILGGRGRAITRAAYSRNISPNWNFGIDYRGMFIDKQISRLGKGDRVVRSQYYDFYTAYQTKDSTYRLFANFRRQNHQVAESGGVRTDIFTPFDYERYFSIDAQPRLTEALSKELRMNFHLYHQYAVGKGLQAYHSFDRYRQGNTFFDFPARESPGYLDYFELDNDTTDDRSKFRVVRNEAGIKGSLSKLFYNGYYALRNYRMTFPSDTLLGGASQARRSGVESYLGGRIALFLDSLLEVRGWAELMQNGNYRIEGKIISRWFEATVKQLQYEPTFIQQYYRSNNDFWKNNFSAINATQLSGAIHYRNKVFEVSPGLTFTRIGNYVFFKSVRVETGGEQNRVGRYPDWNTNFADVMPVQTSSEQVIASPELRLNITLLRHVHVRNYGIYTRLLEQSDNAISIPELFVNSQLSYENIFFNGNLDMHAGVDVHWKSPYYAMAYDVPTQQFYIQGAPDALNSPFLLRGDQGTFKTPNFPVIDLFFNAKIKRGRVFFRYNNVMQLVAGKGYFATPFYPGQRNTVDFGFDWSFYD